MVTGQKPMPLQCNDQFDDGKGAQDSSDQPPHVLLYLLMELDCFRIPSTPGVHEPSPTIVTRN